MRRRAVYKKILTLPRYPALWIVRVYQKVFSPDHSFWAKWFFPDGYCMYYPTCSEYGHQVIREYGLVRGILKAGWRILRCNPWSKGGVDRP
ncbi:MAG: membrane protein insertion efficiency factor YidD [Candidatus Magasanikbacteria bacterium CG10_big_fil_rev_8_21_14_0_10_43_6]|uniref:Putative membrane protein insertion efficiency factor n=1 Tax=Candidatus Magasanikbacteria bacterium CG10_big_fil_rev_8_21_14_0_10_43_6 TaxID=1974650 RepID=A0A2M6W1U5_9BACT|nr:MAG: membrane protein insertion efficiency factor YidD [Candidatus Magasanikbacteria bacterium CG10_big_fil_rev_8_21_14_0_10_43_6]